MFVDGAHYYGCEVCGEWVREDEVKRINDKTLCPMDFYLSQAEVVANEKPRKEGL
jgi:formylmethanofuran dehydrogenase subunit E